MTHRHGATSAGVSLPRFVPLGTTTTAVTTAITTATTAITTATTAVTTVTTATTTTAVTLALAIERPHINY